MTPTDAALLAAAAAGYFACAALLGAVKHPAAAGLAQAANLGLWLTLALAYTLFAHPGALGR